ncbi:hypothetical protein [Sorangium sp. So ce1182]|uniref:hypothetical protein n=1 Tax=Sorangium sp. So ce1182 TaxID=3133334 RepID=UPI003F60A137
MDPLEAQRREFSAAKLAWLLLLLLQLAALALALLGFRYEKQLALTTVLAGVFIPVTSVVLKKYAGDRYSKGESIRRLLAYNNGWGKAFEPSEQLLLSAETTSLPSWDPRPIDTYYNSKKLVGAARVAHITQQSASYTLRFASATMMLAAIPIVAAVTAGSVLLILAIQGLDAAGGKAQITQFAGTLLAFSVSSEFLQLVFAYSELVSACKNAVTECGKLAKEGRPNVQSVYLAVGAYDCALAKAPPIPGLIYRLRRERAEQDWYTHGDHPPNVPDAHPSQPGSTNK